MDTFYRMTHLVIPLGQGVFAFGLDLHADRSLLPPLHACIVTRLLEHLAYALGLRFDRDMESDNIASQTQGFAHAITTIDYDILVFRNHKHTDSDACMSRDSRPFDVWFCHLPTVVILPV